jgi:hypothetical protein
LEICAVKGLNGAVRQYRHSHNRILIAGLFSPLAITELP